MAPDDVTARESTIVAVVRRPVGNTDARDPFSALARAAV
jgi:hypothetical protein